MLSCVSQLKQSALTSEAHCRLLQKELEEASQWLAWAMKSCALTPWVSLCLQSRASAAVARAQAEKQLAEVGGNAVGEVG